jgi:DNA-binding protein HU-beta
MTKAQLQVALAAATETNKKTAGVFLDTLGELAYKEIKKNGEFVLPGFGKLVKQKRKARTGFNPKTQQKIKIPAKTVVKFRVAKAAKDAVLRPKATPAAKRFVANQNLCDTLLEGCAFFPDASIDKQLGMIALPVGDRSVGNERAGCNGLGHQ